MNDFKTINADYCTKHGIPSKWLPDFEPTNGNEDASVLFVFERPGPKSVAPIGSGVISQHNNDPSARNMKAQLAESGLNPSQIAITNIVPHVQTDDAKVKDNQVTSDLYPQGAEHLNQIMNAMPNLRYVILGGNKAQTGFHSHIKMRLGVRFYDMWHTSNQGSGNGKNPASKYYPRFHENVDLMKHICNMLRIKR